MLLNWEQQQTLKEIIIRYHKLAAADDGRISPGRIAAAEVRVSLERWESQLPDEWFEILCRHECPEQIRAVVS